MYILSSQIKPKCACKDIFITKPDIVPVDGTDVLINGLQNIEVQSYSQVTLIMFHTHAYMYVVILIIIPVMITLFRQFLLTVSMEIHKYFLCHASKQVGIPFLCLISATK